MSPRIASAVLELIIKRSNLEKKTSFISVNIFISSAILKALSVVNLVKYKYCNASSVRYKKYTILKSYSVNG